MFAGCEGSSPSNPTTAGGSSPSPGATATATPTATSTPLSPSEELERADVLMREAEYEEAASAYQAAADQTPDQSQRADALLGLAVARKAAGESQAAVDAASQARDEAAPNSAVWRQAAFLRGRYLAELGNYPEAIATLQPLVDAGAGALQGYALADLQLAALGAGDAALAEATSARLAAETGVPDAVLDAAQRRNVAAARDSGDTARYALELERLVAITGYASDRYELATLYASLGREADRIAQLQRITLESSSTSFAATAVAELEAAGQTVNALLKGFILYRTRSYAEAAAVLAPVVEARASLSPEDQAFAVYYLAASLEDQGNYEAAHPLYDLVSDLAPDSAYAHRAQYWAARVLENLGDYASASARYVSLVNSDTAGEFTEEAAFRAGYVLHSAGDPSGAVAAWSALGSADARVLFWRGMAQKQLGLEAEAAASFQAATAAGPLDFHGVEAARATGQLPALDVSYRLRNLDAKVDWAAIETWLQARIGGAPEAAPAEAAAELAALGLHSEAEEVLLDMADAEATTWRLLAVSRQAHELGLKGVAARLADRLRIEEGFAWHEAPVDLLAVAYPVGYSAALDREAKANGVDPLFMAALIRTESFWEPQAISPVGALGLTQVMPETGAAIADALGVDGFETASLLRPATSLRFGTYYIGEQLKEFQYPYVALAAYNGGPGRAARWLETWDGVSAASFAEGVDIEETRNYVELVLMYYARYEAAHGDPGR